MRAAGEALHSAACGRTAARPGRVWLHRRRPAQKGLWGGDQVDEFSGPLESPTSLTRTFFHFGSSLGIRRRGPRWLVG
jgi:hypothetical protein